MPRKMHARTITHVERVIYLRSQGFSIQQISDIIGDVSKGNVHSIIKNDGRYIESQPWIDTEENRELVIKAEENKRKREEKKLPKKRFRLSTEQMEEIKKARDAGDGIRKIARNLEISYGVVYNFLKSCEPVVTVKHKRKSLVYVGRKRKKYYSAKMRGEAIFILIDENSEKLRIGLQHIKLEKVPGAGARRETYRVVKTNDE